MSVLIWIAAAWLAAALGVTVAFFAARRSRLVYGWMFGERPAAEVHRLAAAAPRGRIDRPSQLAA